jgi:hypothetical protein
MSVYEKWAFIKAKLSGTADCIIRLKYVFLRTWDFFYFHHILVNEPNNEINEGGHIL